ncbi:MAG TPA: PEP-CTERM sorting domain-containing protein [Alphaproteobacteria bacterium]|nr:PEP-CTERM sorting domain-containing protein [Alphaproteobacteria bacterium]
MKIHTPTLSVAVLAALWSGFSPYARAAVSYSTGSVNFDAGFGQQVDAPLGGSDTGCDSDAGVAACGDLLKVTGVSNQAFSGGPAPNGTNYVMNNFVFHVEDTNGGVSGDYGTGAILASSATCPTNAFCESIQLGNSPNDAYLFELPYTINFGFAGDTFGFDPNVVLGTLKFQGKTYTVTSLGTVTLGNAGGDDDKSYSGQLLLNFTDPADDPPVPEPSSFVVLGGVLAALGLARRRAC